MYVNFPIFYSFLCVLIGILSSCGYHLGESDLAKKYKSISIPYVEGDLDGDLTGELIRQISSRTSLKYLKSGGNLVLEVRILDYTDENVGFRYDRDKQGHLKKDVIPTETRCFAIAEITLLESYSGNKVIGPVRIGANVVYDHDYYSSRNSINVFSLGQLDNIDTAREIAQHPLNQELARKIVDYISNAW